MVWGWGIEGTEHSGQREEHSKMPEAAESTAPEEQHGFEWLDYEVLGVRMGRLGGCDGIKPRARVRSWRTTRLRVWA